MPTTGRRRCSTARAASSTGILGGSHAHAPPATWPRRSSGRRPGSCRPTDVPDGGSPAGRDVTVAPTGSPSCYRRYEDEKRTRAPRRLRRPARPVRRRHRHRPVVRRRPTVAVPAPVRRRVPGRQPAPGAAAAGVARRPGRPVRRGRSQPGDLPLERCRRLVPRRLRPPTIPAPRWSSSTTTTGRRRRSCRRPPSVLAGERGRPRRRCGPTGPSGPVPTVVGYETDGGEAARHRPGAARRPRARRALVGAGGARAHQRPDRADRGGAPPGRHPLSGPRRPGAARRARRARPAAAASAGRASRSSPRWPTSQPRCRRTASATATDAPTATSRRRRGGGDRRPARQRRRTAPGRAATVVAARRRLPRPRPPCADVGVPGWLAATVRSEEPDRCRRRGHAGHVPRRQGAGVAGGAPGRHGGRSVARSPTPANPTRCDEERRLLYVAVTRAQRDVAAHLGPKPRRSATERGRAAPSPYLRQVLDATGRLTDAASAGRRARRFPPGGRLDGPDWRPPAPIPRRLPIVRCSTPSGRGERAKRGRRAWRRRRAGRPHAGRRRRPAAGRRRPSSHLLPGIGPIKAERYGATLLALVAEHRTRRAGELTVRFEMVQRFAAPRRTTSPRPSPTRTSTSSWPTLPNLGRPEGARSHRRRRHRPAPGPLPVHRRPLGGRRAVIDPSEAHVGRGVRARPHPPPGHASASSPTTTPTGFGRPAPIAAPPIPSTPMRRSARPTAR